MNWLVYLLALWLLTGVQLGAAVLAPGGGEIMPSLPICLLVFVSLTASPRHALWAAVVLGLALDLTHALPYQDARAAVTVPGPNVLGCTLAAQFVLACRGMVIQRNVFTHGVLGLVVGLIASIVVIAIYSVRGFYPASPAFTPLVALRNAGASAVFTGVLAMGAVPLLFLFAKAFGTAHPHGYAPSGRPQRRLRMLDR